MTADIKPYPAYKDSGVPWLGQVPEHWEVKKVRDAARVINGYPFDAARFSTKTGHPLIRIRDLNKSHTAVLYDGPFVDVARVEPGEVLVGMDGDFNIGVWSGEDVALLNQRMCCIRSQLRVTSRFLRYALPLSLQLINDICWSTTVKHLSSGQIERIKFGCPTVAEQAAIVRYLDHADRKVRHAIRARQQLIKLLTEQKQAIIQRAVTRGLDPNIRLKPSGVAWLGDVPEHWGVDKIKHLARPGYKTLVDGDWIESPYITSDGIRLIQTGNIGIGTYREQGFRYVNGETFDSLSCTEVMPGDVLICRLGDPVGRACLAPRLGVRMITSVDVCILKPRADINPVFLVNVMTSRQYLSWVGSLVRGSTRDRVSRSMLGGFTLPMPPLLEQDAIVRFLNNATASLDKAIDVAHREIDLLREYRTRLIADVVTGKLDVRNVPVPSDETDVLPEDVETIDHVDAADQGDDAAEGNSESNTEESA